MDYIELKASCPEEFKEIFIAELAEIGYESFIETDEGIAAYIPESDFKIDAVEEIRIRYADLAGLAYEANKMARINWNEEWEKNYEPIEVDDQIFIHATFHEPRPHIPINIIVNPKMSFGTGHHATTWQMAKLQLEVDHKDKSVLDIGCGTGILAILAGKLGAKSVEGFDIDDWAVDNSIENAQLNSITAEFQKGTLAELHYPGPYDILLANINKGVLTAEIPSYARILKPKGYLLISGFYEIDIPDIRKVFIEAGLKEVKYTVKSQWAAMLLVKEDYRG